MMRWQHFGRDLKRRRDRLGIGHRDAAEQIGTSHATVCRAENAKPISTEAFMSACVWMGSDPMKYFQQAE